MPIADNATTLSNAEMKEHFYKMYDQLTKEEKMDMGFNLLIVLDDVVAAVKKYEHDPRLAQLIMNRRHLIFGGVVSIIIVTQKYTLIPARIRSNASWLILFRLNPLDFDNVY